MVRTRTILLAFLGSKVKYLETRLCKHKNVYALTSYIFAFHTYETSQVLGVVPHLFVTYKILHTTTKFL